VTDEEAVKRLKRSVVEWNAWREAHPGATDANLSDADLRDANLIAANLFGANLFGADLIGAKLIRAQLSRANLVRAKLSDADLSEAKLIGANLSGADLSDANLSDANFGAAILSGADLVRANLISAKLSSADLSDADLSLANLTCADLLRAKLIGAKLIRAKLIQANLGANLSGANLTGAQLSDANLFGAKLIGANLSGAVLSDTIFGNVNLSGVIGLETCRHLGPSTIDHRTIEKSGQLPLSFLRGVGLPDRLINYLPSVFDQAIQYFSCFISYSAIDEEFAKRINSDLQNSGVRCWFAPHDLPIGEGILEGIDAAIRVRDKVLLILSEHSIRSGWVKDEVNTGFEEERKRGQNVLFPVRLDDTVMTTNEAWAAKLRAKNIGDFRRWKDHDAYKQSFERVVRDLTKS
jgi:uncharacterized protein YjbI with pentapeptide repeats